MTLTVNQFSVSSPATVTVPKNLITVFFLQFLSRSLLSCTVSEQVAILFDNFHTNFMVFLGKIVAGIVAIGLLIYKYLVGLVVVEVQNQPGPEDSTTVLVRGI